MFVAFTTYNTEGQFDGSSFALEVKSINFHGMSNDGLLVDLSHMSGAKERITVVAKPYGNFEIGPHDRILNFTIVEYPSCNIVSEDGFHERVGRGRFLNAQGHFA